MHSWCDHACRARSAVSLLKSRLYLWRTHQDSLDFALKQLRESFPCTPGSASPMSAKLQDKLCFVLCATEHNVVRKSYSCLGPPKLSRLAYLLMCLPLWPHVKMNRTLQNRKFLLEILKPKFNWDYCEWKTWRRKKKKKSWVNEGEKPRNAAKATASFLHACIKINNKWSLYLLSSIQKCVWFSSTDLALNKWGIL